MENSKYIINLIIKRFTNWCNNKCTINILSKKKKKKVLLTTYQIRIILEIQMILQKFLLMADMMSDY